MIAAINDASNEDSRQARTAQRENLKEFQESLLVQDYNLAIREQFQGKKEEARSIYLRLLDSPLLSRQATLSKDLAHLKYSTLKNLATIEREREATKDDALRHFAEATELDYLDPSLWYQIGNLALEKRRLMVARQAFERGLNLNSNHLLCRAKLLETLVLIGDFYTANELIDQWLIDDPGNTRLTVLRRAIEGPEMSVPRQGDAAAIKYVTELAQRRTAMCRPIAEPALLAPQVCKMSLASWAALVTRLSGAVDACKKSRALFGQPLRLLLPGMEAPADAAAATVLLDDTLGPASPSVEITSLEPKQLPDQAPAPSAATPAAADAQAKTASAAPRGREVVGRRAPSSRHAEVRSQLQTLLTELGVLGDDEGDDEGEGAQGDATNQGAQDVTMTDATSQAAAAQSAPVAGASDGAKAAEPSQGAACAQAEVTALVQRLQGGTPAEWVGATLEAVLHSASVSWTADFVNKFLHLIQTFPRITPLPLEITLAATELQLDGVAPDAGAQLARVLRATNECHRMLAAMPEPPRALALRLYWLRVRYEIVAGDPDAACRALVALRDFLRECEAGVEVVLSHLRAPYNVISVAAVEAHLRKTTDQNQVAIAANALQCGRHDDVIKQLLPLFVPDDAEAREATYRQALRVEMLDLLARAAIAGGAWATVVLALLRALEEKRAGGDAGVAVRVAALALGEQAKRGELSLRHFEAPAHAFRRVVLLLGDVLRLDKFDKATQVELWLALYHLTTLTPDGAKLPARLGLLTHAHDQLANFQSACRAAGGRLLLTLLELLTSRREAAGAEDEAGAATDSRKQLNQCLQCCFGVKVGTAQHKGDELPVGRDELLQLYGFLAPLIEHRALKKTAPLKEPFERIMRVHPQPPELLALRAQLQDFLVGTRAAPPEALAATVPHYDFHRNLYWHAGIVGVATEEILQNDLVINPDRCDSWYTLGNIYFSMAGDLLDGAVAAVPRNVSAETKYQVECLHTKALKCFAETLCWFEREPSKLQCVTESRLLNRIGALCYLHAKWICPTVEHKLDLLLKAEGVYSRLSTIEPLASDPAYTDSLALRLDSFIMLGKIKRLIGRPVEEYMAAFARAVELNEPFRTPGDKKENPQGDPMPLYHLHSARFRLIAVLPGAETTALAEKYRFKPASEIPDLVEDVIAALKQSTMQHQYWRSSPFRSQYRLARIYASSLGGYRFEEARNALMLLRKKGAVGAKLWVLWTEAYQRTTQRAGKSFAYNFEKLNALLLAIAEHLPVREALEASALVARTKPPHDVLLRAVSIYAACIDRQVEQLLTELPEIIRQLNLPAPPEGTTPAEPPHKYLDKEVRMKELMEIYDMYLTSKSLPPAQNPMRRALQRADRFYSLLDRERPFEDVVRLLEERRPHKAKALQRKQEAASKEANSANAVASAAPAAPAAAAAAPKAQSRKRKPEAEAEDASSTQAPPMDAAPHPIRIDSTLRRLDVGPEPAAVAATDAPPFLRLSSELVAAPGQDEGTADM